MEKRLNRLVSLKEAIKLYRKKMIKEWWLKDALNKTEKKLEKQDNITKEMIEFYEGRLYQKDVKTPTLHNNWISISNNDLN